MQQKNLTNKNIESHEELITPIRLKKETEHFLTPSCYETVENARKTIENILDDKDDRKLLIIGPCSVHNLDEALEYASLLKPLHDAVFDKFYIVMRTYFEKPRSELGWEGFISDPDINGKCDLKKGLRLARELAISINNMGLPIATETLDFVTPQYLDDLISWAAIGARTSESQPHRKMASGMSMPVGFKNNVYGDVEVAINAVKKAVNPQVFVGMTEHGIVALMKTKGNPYSHVILRGGNGKPNYNPDFVNEIARQLESKGLPSKIIVDCSHGNTNKNYQLQPDVFRAVMKNSLSTNKSIIGVMVESNLDEGNQKIPADPKEIKPRISITDGCLGWDATKDMIFEEYSNQRVY